MGRRHLARKACRVVMKWIARALYGPRAAHLPPDRVLMLAFFQKILGVNCHVPWIVHFSSQVLHHENMDVPLDVNPGYSPGCYIQAINGIRIGTGVRIGPNVALISANHDLSDYRKHTKAPPMEIGSGVWIGANSVILPGVRIGARTVVGAGSVVAKELPSDCVAVGNPCRPVRYLTSAERVAKPDC